MTDRPDNEKSPAVDSFKELASHAFYAAIEAPVEGGYQLVNEVTGNNLPNWHCALPAGDSTWAHAGDLIGSAALFLGVSKLTGLGASKLGLGEVTGEALTASTTRASLQSFATGASVGLLQPVAGKDYWSNKVKFTAQSGLSFAMMGGAGRLLDSTGRFGVAGARTIGQSVSIGALSGTAGGITDAIAKSELFDQRLPTFNEVVNTTASYAAFGGIFGAMESTLPDVKNMVNSRTFAADSAAAWHRLPIQAGDRTLVMDAKAHEIVPGPHVDLPLLDMSNYAPVKFSQEPATTAAARAQSRRYVKEGVVVEPFENGVRLATSASSDGFTADGARINPREVLMSIDKLHDPVLNEVLQDAKGRFADIADQDQLASNISRYVNRVFNRYNLDGESLERLYSENIRKMSSQTVPIGEFIRRGNGACLQQAALFKSIGEEAGLKVRLFEGTVEKGEEIAHVWPDVEMQNHQHLIYDPAQQNYGALEYRLPKQIRS